MKNNKYKFYMNIPVTTKQGKWHKISFHILDKKYLS